MGQSLAVMDSRDPAHPGNPANPASLLPNTAVKTMPTANTVAVPSSSEGGWPAFLSLIALAVDGLAQATGMLKTSRALLGVLETKGGTKRQRPFRTENGIAIPHSLACLLNLHCCWKAWMHRMPCCASSSSPLLTVGGRCIDVSDLSHP